MHIIWTETFRGRVNRRKVNAAIRREAREHSDYGVGPADNVQWHENTVCKSEEAAREYVERNFPGYRWGAVRFKDKEGHINWLVKAEWHE